ncbi:MAG: molybdate ABC transporter substrate-binding protein [Candidatus Electryonea clarkiae]|nr:molybdate ABC transporter substrate-binding protein [Candidatus Electryonea clarkiae]MDP8287108.1 molybdate ABC transporter substrate-binding protein [Candidatus Electryonea clarkiae]
MRRVILCWMISGLLILPFLTEALYAGEIKIAVASNFTNVIRDISRKFENQTGHKVILIFGSTGKHYAQIVNGAPFDIFFAADVQRPKLLEEQGFALKGSRFTYAIGKLALWSPQDNYVDKSGEILRHGDFRHLAIANPKLAPYGEAARAVLQSLDLWDSLHKKLVRGENISQAFQLIKSGNAELGLVALSQVIQAGYYQTDTFWVVPEELYPPIEQQVVLLKDNPIARAYLKFIQTDEIKEMICSFGYSTK